jgi:hypothetical protein
LISWNVVAASVDFLLVYIVAILRFPGIGAWISSYKIRSLFEPDALAEKMGFVG